jgi:hypothetical protein
MPISGCMAREIQDTVPLPRRTLSRIANSCPCRLKVRLTLFVRGGVAANADRRRRVHR